MKTNNRLIARERIAHYAELTNRPIIGKGSLYYHYEGAQAGTYALYERANDAGGIRVIRRFKSIQLLWSYLDGAIDTLTERKANVAKSPKEGGYARVHVNCSPHASDGETSINVDADYFCFDFKQRDDHINVVEQVLDSALDIGSIHSYYIQRVGTTVNK